MARSKSEGGEPDGAHPGQDPAGRAASKAAVAASLVALIARQAQSRDPELLRGGLTPPIAPQPFAAGLGDLAQYLSNYCQTAERLNLETWAQLTRARGLSDVMRIQLDHRRKAAEAFFDQVDRTSSALIRMAAVAA